MNILWVCNSVLPEAAELLGLDKLPFGGWFVSVSSLLACLEDISLSIAFPQLGFSKIKRLDGEKITYYVFPPYLPKSKGKSDIKEIIEHVRPEIIHIFGTEYPHSLEALRSADLNRCVVNIQGLTSILQRHYFAGLPSGLLKRQTLRDFIKRDSITKQKERFERQGASEIEALKTAKHVIGRTTWDLACVKQINPQINYHFCSEILREEFYKHRWDLNNCLRYSVFTSQGSYPVKGLHFLLEAMPIVLRSFPQVRLYVGGYDITRDVKIKDKLRISSYGKYLRGLIKKLGLKENVIFTGVLDEKTMCDRLLKSNVFVSPSTIENESNSLSEAKIMGVPCVASYVGGVTDRIEHGVDGFFYQHDAPYMLAFYICRIFESDALALTLSENAIKSAQAVNNADENLNRLLCIYKQVLHRA